MPSISAEVHSIHVPLTSAFQCMCVCVRVRVCVCVCALYGTYMGAQAGALWALSEGHEANMVSIAGAGAIATLCQLLGSENERAQRHAASALASMSAGSPSNQEEITKILVRILGTRGWRWIDVEARA